MEGKNYYLEVDFKFESKTAEELADFLKNLDIFLKENGAKKCRIGVPKENPVYDSFGNLWE